MWTTKLGYSKWVIAFAVGASAAASTTVPAASHGAEPAVIREASRRYIVEASTTDVARQSVARVGGAVERSLDIIHGVEAQLNPWQKTRLSLLPGVRLYEDRGVKTEGATAAATSALSTVTSAIVSQASGSASLSDGTAVDVPTVLYQTDYTVQVGASTLQAAGTTGRGVTIAVLDTGLWIAPGQTFLGRILATIDVTTSGSAPVTGDPDGHGTHVTSIAAGGAMNIAGGYFGIAPKANLVIVRAFNAEGAGTYADVIAGLNWIVANKAKYNIRVLNLSFGATPQSDYWNDPLDQAVMAAWKAGIVVVAAAGNDGPSPMTVDVPGNVPYIITVGAITDNYTPYVYSDDRLASFSSTGPTYEGFVKPEVVAPGGHMVGSMQSTSYLANIDPGSMNPTESLFTMSGTSQAAAVTSGVVALMLQADPSLTPDNVKCQLMASARPALTSAGTLAYSVFQQGAGLVNAVSAVNSTATGCANVGLNISADLAGTEHFGGPANVDASGNYYVMNMAASSAGTPLAGDGLHWSSGYVMGAYTFTEGYLWSQGFVWSNGYPWSSSVNWTSSTAFSQGYLWRKDVPWWNTTGTAGGTTSPASIEDWVPNQ
jgi:subtilisin family serine protease